jgi:hypothetical protein
MLRVYWGALMFRAISTLFLLASACSGDSTEDSGVASPNTSYESPCGVEVGEGTAALQGLDFTSDYPDSGIDIGLMGRACVEPGVGWSGYFMYYQRVQGDVPLYLTGSVWEISTTTTDSDCVDCAFSFETDEATALARVGDPSWNTTEFTLSGIGIGSLDDAQPLIYFNQEGAGYVNISTVGDYSLDGEISSEGDYYDYSFDQYGLYY